MNFPLYRWQNRDLEGSRDLPLMYTNPRSMHTCVQMQGTPCLSGGARARTQAHVTACMGGLVGVYFLHIFSVPRKIHHFLFL